MIPSYIRKYFWDTDTRDLDPKKYGVYIIKRLLEYGNPKSLGWAWQQFAKKLWMEALRGRQVSKKSQSFWRSLVLLKKT